MSYHQLATSTTLSIPKVADASTLSQLFNLPAYWSPPQPSSLSDLSTTPVNTSPTNRWLIDHWNVSSSKVSNTEFVANPFGGEEMVLSVDYPKGTRDGSQFFMSPVQPDVKVRTAVLQYEVAFDEGFNFVKGGKLPGLYGSRSGSESICSGGSRLATCFSARLMWRQRGLGEVYAYIPTYDGFCRQSDVDCNDTYGISLSRGSFRFAPGGWTRITQLISLNTPPYANGLLYLFANDTLALAHTGLVWRTDESVTLSKIMFSTFFGGSDESWDSRGGKSYFRNFEVFAGLNPSNTSGPAVNATLSTTSTSPRSIEPSLRVYPYFYLMVFLLSLFDIHP